MRAIVYNGPRDVSVEQVEDPRIERPTDVLVRVTTTNICGSDLHFYDGRTDLAPGTVVGHENQGEVIEVGAAVDRIKVGDRVNLPFNIACGFCRNCVRGYPSACLTTNPGSAGAAYGYSQMGPYRGGQAELLRVPYADYNALVLPPDAEEKATDYVMLADIFPTGWHATRLAQLEPGESVAIWGSGPVGLMAAYSAMLQGASQVFVVDRQMDRLRLAESIGAIAIDDSAGSPVDQIMELTGGQGADKGCECVGYQAHEPDGDEHPEMTLDDLIAVVRPTGVIGVVGVFMPQDPKGPDPLERQGRIAFDMGLFFQKGLQMGSGQCPVKRYNERLMALIHEDRARPSFIVSHELPLDQAPEAYRHFDARDDGWTKVVLRPAA
jgi:threonine dehydrogenase-like Zn-dependent dehydrogenase